MTVGVAPSADGPIGTALKEWATVTHLLAEGRYTLVLRKGGIREAGGPGKFKLEHQRFALFPAWEHEKPHWLKPQARAVSSAAAPATSGRPDRLHLTAWAELGRAWVVPSRSAFDTLDDLHPWLPPQIDLRFNYKAFRPLYLLALRVRRLSTPRVVPNRAAYDGCKSWVPLDPADAVAPSGAETAMSDQTFTSICARVDAAFGA